MARIQQPTDGGYRLTLNMRPEEYKMLTRLAEQQDRTRSWIAQRAVKEMFERHFKEENA